MKSYAYTYGNKFKDERASELIAGGCIVAIGFFDGVHMAHRKLIAAARKEADTKRLPLLIFTFSAGDSIKSHTQRIYTDAQKSELLLAAGADAIIFCDFDSVKELDGKVFADDVLCRDMHAKAVVCGFNFRFGRGAEDDAVRLSEYLSHKGVDAVIIDDYLLGKATLSSTMIRAMLAEGRIEEANDALGVPYFIDSSVKHGNGVGKTLGIPTVNSDTPEERILPALGVYLTETEVRGKRYPSLTNVGKCPTFGERRTHLETFILDFDGDIYDEKIRIKFLSFLRREKTFSSEKELIMQIKIDKNKAIKLYGESKWLDSGHN